MLIKPKISIIIPVLNNLIGLQKTIESIQRQTYTDFEVWIIDGKSSKDTHDYLKKLEYPFQFISEKDSGIYDAMNKGISLSKGEWLYFLGAGDCLSKATILSEISNFFEPTLEICYGNISYKNKVFTSSFSKIMWIKHTLHHQAVFYHIKIFEQTKYNVFYKVLSDYNLNLQLLQEKRKSKKINEVLAFCEEEGISKKYNLQLYQEELHLKKRKLSVIYHPFLYFLFCAKYFLKGLLKV